MRNEKNITPKNKLKSFLNEYIVPEYDPSVGFYENEDIRKYFDNKYEGWEKHFLVLKQIWCENQGRKTWEERKYPF